ncbi:Right handed beta helix region [Malonomonas rubra DSM 5091]|uniref:Right handed beta helix region n=1 Tax=Malonomonas rubra DSM 5091 TaxID=1122189 RepID=A0A1M6KCE6_MALRU|nr:right-handed parallel beta-helix repeat-containing protein [Malonomonas rubra]SHJ56589.1 Right handed beta helix region [Malonomonas rubra DSM 5091]
MKTIKMVMVLVALSGFLSFSEAEVVTFEKEQYGTHVYVSGSAELNEVLRNIRPGTTVIIPAGNYNRGFAFRNVNGLPDAPIVIEGSDPDNPPIFEGRGEGLKVSNSSYIKFKNITFKGFTTNGINIDDGGKIGQPSHHIILDNITVLDTGPKGNNDALKMSGVDHFIIRNSHFEGWGGAAIDMVGCHHGVIENSTIVGKEGYRTAVGAQMKGGSRLILLQNNYFENAGTRMVQIGGSTGLKYFRPAETAYEADSIQVKGNVFVGGEAQLSWVTTQNSLVSHNLFIRPQKWLGRILQETENPRFAPSQTGIFENNLVVLGDKKRNFINVGRGTLPQSFVFQKNVWDASEKDVEKSLPVRENHGGYKFQFQIEDDHSGRLSVTNDDPRIEQVGPAAYKPWSATVEFADIDLLPILPVTSSLGSVALVDDRWLAVIATVSAGALGVGALGWVMIRPHVARNRKRRRRKRDKN